MSEAKEQQLRRVIDTLLQSDPIIKLLQEVKLGRMKPTDAGLRAIAEAWLGTYQRIFETLHDLDKVSILQLDPLPRLAVLIEAGVLTPDHKTVSALRASFEQALAQSRSE